MTHLDLSLPPPVAEAVYDADPRLAVYVQRNALGWWTFLLAPLTGALVLSSAGPLAALGLTGFIVVVMAAGFLIGHTFHRRAVHADTRTPTIRQAARLVDAYNDMVPGLTDTLAYGGLSSNHPLLAEARQLRLDVQGYLGAAEELTRNRPRLGRGQARISAQPLFPPDEAALLNRLRALTDAVEALPRTYREANRVLSFPNAG